jgi:flagellar biosynthesis protein FlhB
MAEDNESNSEKPTEKRLDDAHERGQFARAPEIQVVAGLLAASIIVLLTMKNQAIQIAAFSTGLFGHLNSFEIKVEGISDWTLQAVIFVLGLALPMVVTCAIAGILAGGLQTRFRLAPKIFDDAFSKIDPIKGFSRTFSKDAFFRLAIDSVKFAVVGSVIYGAIKRILGDPLFYLPVPAQRLGEFLGVLALLNYVYQHFKVQKSMMMSRHDVKEEMKESNGDPLVKMAQRQMARRLMQKQMLAAIPTADVIITNPTHFAVALKYERNKDAAPVVLAKGENAFAQRIKALAAEHEVPMVENKPVARALFKHARVGEAIPAQLYQAVAEILGYVYRTHRLYFHQLRARRMSH